MAAKKRKFSEDYIKFGFTFKETDESQLPQCVICMKVLSNYSMRPNRLERHLKQQHPTLVLKTKEFFSSKAESLKRLRLDKSGSYHTGVSQHLKASFEIAFMIAKQKKPHTIGEELIKPCALKATQIILEDAEQKMKSISLSNNTAKRRIDDIAADIKSQIINKVKLSPFFAISCDESTDIVNCAQLIVYDRYIGGDIIEAYSQSLTAGKLWLPKHCTELRQTLDSAIRTVNYIKSSALNSRLFTLICEDLDSNHKVLLFHTEVVVLARLYEVKEEVNLFLELKEKHDLLTMFKDDTFQCILAYLTDIFDTLNELNLKLQGRNGTIISNYDYIQGFIAKLQLWNKKLSSENVISFSRLFEVIKNNKLDANLKADIKIHLQALEDEFRRHYRDIDSESPIWHMTRNPFVVDVLQLPEEVQKEFLEMKTDSSMKDEFHLLTLEKFWIKRLPVNSKLASLTLRVLIPFSSTYLCETGFSALVLIKTKQRNRLDVDSHLMIALARTEPRINQLVQNMQKNLKCLINTYVKTFKVCLLELK
ncbi:unnamed protein product [Parnassius apollo]|uniref:(apollo) hypothetical protein n=1 Tax=Parnassius apollo TaxID=110799 RepID=A0A8S3WTX8_PARAO|nr:unnamed protein product [Parnassius apollo]